jgi:transposase
MEIDVKLATRQSRELLEIIERLSNEKKEITELVATLTSTIEKQNENIEKQNENILNMTKRIEYLEFENRHQREIIDARNKRLFGRKSEKLSHDELQYWLFNEIEAVAREKVSTIVVKEHTRTKRGRKPISDSLPRIEIVHDIPEDRKRCAHGKTRPRIGQDVREEVSIVPLKVFVKRHIYPKYGPCDCEACKADKDAEPIVSAPQAKRIIPGSMADETMLAYLATSKFCDSLPFYRQEKIMRRYGIEYGRETMCNQMIRISEACSELIELMWQEARSGPIMNMDETHLRVLNEAGREPGKKSWMWVAVGRPGGKKIVLFHYHRKRSGEVARKLLEGYSGYLQSDGYSAYHAVTDSDRIISVGCWAHVRRKFIDAKGLEEYASHADEALALIAKLFHIDDVLREQNLTENDFVRVRREQSQPLLDELYCWLNDKVTRVPPSFNLYKAIRYTLNEWPGLTRYLDHAYLTPDNNIAENAIRPFVVGRKNWLFANTPRGAHASACLYSLIESAKANCLDPFDYLSWLFIELPKTSKENIRNLLPHVADPAIVNGFVRKTVPSIDGAK